MTTDIERLEAEMLGIKKQLGTMRSALQNAGIIDKPKEGECRLGYEGECPEAKPYQYQKGCRNEQCRKANREYYGKNNVTEPKVEPPKKAPKKLVKRG